MQVSQIFLSDKNQLVSPELLHQVERLKRLYLGYQYTLYDNITLREFIKNNFEPRVSNAYDQLVPYAYKADLGRYCILHKIGGWYFDISVNLINCINPPLEIESIAYRDIQIFSGTSWSVWNGALYSKPKNPVFLDAIEIIVNNCQNKFYGISPLCPTGPTVLGHAFAKRGASASAVFGDLMTLTPGRQILNKAFILPDGLIHGFAKNLPPGDLQTEGTNNYLDLYFQKQIYKTS